MRVFTRRMPVGFHEAKGFLGRMRRDQAVAAASDEVLPPGLDKCFPDGKPSIRFEKLHQRPLQFAISQVAGDIDLLYRERINAGVLHAGGDVEGDVTLHEFLMRPEEKRRT